MARIDTMQIYHGSGAPPALLEHELGWDYTNKVLYCDSDESIVGSVVPGGILMSIVAKTAAYTVTSSDDMVTCGAGNETFNVDIIAPIVSKIYYIKNVGTGVITVDADTTGGSTIDAETTQTLYQYDSLTIVGASDASEWWII